jgi:hypothetical protein
MLDNQRQGGNKLWGARKEKPRLPCEGAGTDAKLELPWLGAGSPLGNPGLGPRGVYKLFRCGKCIRRTKFL